MLRLLSRISKAHDPRPAATTWVFAAVLALLSAPILHGQPPILKLVDAHYNRLTSLRARYTERFVGMGMDRSETGTLTLRKPSRMRWDYDAPPGKVFLLDGKSAWFYTPGDPQAQRISAKQMDDLRSPLRLLLGHTQLAKELGSISVIPSPSGGFHIIGIPHGLENRVRQMSLDVTSTGEITSMKVDELDGAATSFLFTSGQENIPTRASDFTFAPPPGVAVVEGSAPL